MGTLCEKVIDLSRPVIEDEMARERDQLLKKRKPASESRNQPFDLLPDILKRIPLSSMIVSDNSDADSS